MWTRAIQAVVTMCATSRCPCWEPSSGIIVPDSGIRAYSNGDGPGVSNYYTVLKSMDSRENSFCPSGQSSMAVAVQSVLHLAGTMPASGGAGCAEVAGGVHPGLAALCSTMGKSVVLDSGATKHNFVLTHHDTLGYGSVLETAAVPGGDGYLDNISLDSGATKHNFDLTHHDTLGYESVLKTAAVPGGGWIS